MREIKFRAWLKYKKEMVDNARPDFFSKQLHYFCDNSAGGKDVLGVSTEDIELMQYTGLKDKNNKEIYEGDIFHIGSKKILYVVEWIDCGLKGRQIKNKSWIGLDYWKEDIEVIGNIYENSELIKEVREIDGN